MKRRAQVAVEFLTTYGWVIIGILLLFAVLFYYGTFDPMRFVPNQCDFEQGFHCETYRFQGAGSPTAPMRLTVQFSNKLGYDIAFSSNTADIKVENIGNFGKNTYRGNCSPMLPAIIKKDTVVTCIFDIYDKNYTPAAGKKVRFQVELNYTNCVTDPNYFTNRSCALGSNYTSTGVIITPVESNVSTSYGYCGDAECRYPVENPNNCPSDCHPPKTILINVSKNLVTPDGQDYAIASAVVRDENGQLVRGIDVTFISTPIGNVSNYSNLTNINGNASIRITSTVNGTADVSASSYGISNSTKLTFQSIPNLLTLTAYDSSVGNCSGSYIIAKVMDSGGMPLRDVPVNYSVDAGSVGISKLTPSLEVTDVTGYSIIYFSSNATTTPRTVNITARVDLNQYNVHLNASKVVTVVGCQACNAPLQGDWVIDQKIVCENSTIILNGNLNISVDIAYTRKWGDLTFKNVTLVMNSSSGSPGQRGIYMNRMARFTILDNDSNADTIAGASSIIAGGTGQPYVFRINPNAELFVMKNSNLSGAGWNTTPVSSPSYARIDNLKDYRSGLFISSNNSVIQNNTFERISGNFITILLNGSRNTTIFNNTFRSVYTAVGAANSNNNTISNNVITIVPNGYSTDFMSPNPGIWFSTDWQQNSSNNTISYNSIRGTSSSTPAGPALFLEGPFSYNYIANNYFSECENEILIYGNTHHNVFYNNSIFNFSNSGIYLYAYSANNNVFQNNYLNQSNPNFYVNSASIYLYASYSNNFTNNTISLRSDRCNGAYDIELWSYSSGNYFTDNDIYGCRRMLIEGGSSNVVVNRMNLKSDTRNQPYNITVLSSQGVNITNSKNINWVYLSDSGGSTIANNTIVANSTSSYGIRLYNSAPTSIIANNTIGPPSCPLMGRGIDINASPVTVSGNNITNFTEAGIYISSTSLSASGYINNNSITASGSCGASYGIFLSNANYLSINGNKIGGGACGINFSNSEPLVSFNNITTTGTYGVYCVGSTPDLNANNITGSLDNCLGGTCTWSNPWVIDTPIYCNDTIFYPTGNITITGSGRLTLKNTTLVIMSTASANALIQVQNGGRLVISDKDGNPSTNDISNITAQSAKRYSIRVDPGGYLAIRNSAIQRAGNSSVGPGIQLNGNGAVITGNKFLGNYRAVYIGNSNSNQISNNKFLNDTDTFVTVNNSGFNTINGNVVDPGASPFRSIQMYNSSDNSIYGNTLGKEKNASVYIQGPSSNNSLYSNIFNVYNPADLTNATRGIDIESSANNNSIYNNTFFTDSAAASSPGFVPKTALYMDSSNTTLFYNNILTDCTDIYIQSSAKNGIYKNNFTALNATGSKVIEIHSSNGDSIYLNYFESLLKEGYVHLFDSNNESVYNNTMLGALSYTPGYPQGAIYLKNTPSSSISSNFIHDIHNSQPGTAAVYAEGSDWVYITLNDIYKFGGIQLYGSSLSWLLGIYYVQNNTVFNSSTTTSPTKCITSTAHYLFIYGNTVNCSASDYGLYVDPQSYSTTNILQNNFTNNNIGVYCKQNPGSYSIYFTFNNYTNNVQNCSGCPGAPICR